MEIYKYTLKLEMLEFNTGKKIIFFISVFFYADSESEYSIIC